MADDLNPITRTETFLAGNEPDLTPITREEAILAGGDLTPVTRKEWFLKKYRGGGGSSVTVEPLTVTQNGTQTAPSGKAYSPVTVNVPNSYTNSDIGKVVSSESVLIDQSSAAFTRNGEYGTTYTNRITINVQPGQVYFSEDNALSNPFSGLDFDELYARINNDKVFGFLWFEFNSMTIQVELYARNNIIGGMAFMSSPSPVGVLCEWNTSGVVTLDALMGGQVQDMRAYAPQLTAHVYLYGTTEPTPAT